MTGRGIRGLFLISVLVALWLEFLPLSSGLSTARPLWLALTLGYWALYGPNVAVISVAVGLGLVSDTIHDTPLGQHVVGLSLLAYTLIRLRTLLGLYPIWQVTLLLMPVWGLYMLLMFLFDGMARHPSDALARLLPIATSTLCWPLIVLLLDALHGKRITM